MLEPFILFYQKSADIFGGVGEALFWWPRRKFIFVCCRGSRFSDQGFIILNVYFFQSLVPLPFPKIIFNYDKGIKEPPICGQIF
jgi:hypothetical protein